MPQLRKEVLVRNAVFWKQLECAPKRFEIVGAYFVLLFLREHVHFASLRDVAQPYKRTMRTPAYLGIPLNPVLSGFFLESSEVHIMPVGADGDRTASLHLRAKPVSF